MTSSKTIKLSYYDTQVLKGFALILLLCHHCWYEGKDYTDIVLFGIPVFKQIGVFCKLCVAFFVFLSGYGCAESTSRKGGIGNIFNFYRRRYIKLMVNYWFIYILFVPIGIFFFGRTFTDVYGGNYILPAIADFLGLHNVVMGNPFGYNPTWWFYSCIILIYALFPAIWHFREQWYLMIPLAIMMPIFAYYIPMLLCCSSYCLAFICGVSFCVVRPSVVWGGRFLFLLCFVAVCLFRFKIQDPMLWDSAIVLFVVVIYKSISCPSWVAAGLAFLGKHSFNIFLFHTFIYLIYFHPFIYWSKNPVLIFLTLLFVCVIVS